MYNGETAFNHHDPNHENDAEAIQRLEHLRHVAMSLPDNVARRILIDTVDDFIERLTDPERKLGVA